MRVAASRTSPRRRAQTNAAQAPLPQARVSPTPRSKTLSRTRSGESTCAKPTLALSGRAGAAARAADRRRVHRLYVAHEEHRVRVAHARLRRPAQALDLQRQEERVARLS
jgi:hypothetical protein